MVQENSLKKVVVIVGPTAVGKTSLSIKLAKKFNAEIINADQSQMHKGLDIGTAKITLEEMDGVKHYFIDNLTPTENYSIKDYQDAARCVIDKMDKLPFIVGGSGLYVDSLITDYDLTTTKSNHNNSYDDLTNEELYEKLKSLDSNAALKTHPNNRKRVLRYLEIVEEKGTLEVRANKPYYDSLIIFLNKPREELYNNINTRTKLMIDSGWVNEVKNLIDKNINILEIREIGYLEIYKYLLGEISLEEAIALIQQKTRHYAKRQITWFKNKMNCVEINNDEFALKKVINLINDFLNN